MEIKILLPGHIKCHGLIKLVKEVIKEMGVAAEVTEVSDIKEIAQAGGLAPPGLVINGKVKSTGRAINRGEIKKYIEQEMTLQNVAISFAQ